MQRCLQLARLGAGYVAPNPMVGAVLVHNEKIIGEGYHALYGQAHAEVACLHSVRPQDQHSVQQATMYVSLEPCSHFGKTPPCADRIIQDKILQVVVGCLDPFAAVSGRGIQKLKEAGVAVTTGVLEQECLRLNKRFITFQLQHRPYIILKWAQTADGKFGSGTEQRLSISNAYTNRIVHKWRSEEAAILVGTNTALQDDPSLTTRLWPGEHPTRLVIDMHLRLPQHLQIFSGGRTIIFNTIKHEEQGQLLYYQVTEDVSLVHQIVHALYQLKIQSLIVEGGAYLLQSFIDEGVWDEARVITNELLEQPSGLPAPVLKNGKIETTEGIYSDVIRTYLPVS